MCCTCIVLCCVQLQEPFASHPGLHSGLSQDVRVDGIVAALVRARPHLLMAAALAMHMVIIAVHQGARHQQRLLITQGAQLQLCTWLWHAE